MKNLFLLLFIIIIYNCEIISQPCEPQGITLSTQQEIDSFSSNYVGCTSFADIDIIDNGTGDITDLSGLAQIRHLEGNLFIYNNPNLSNLHGLDSLEIVIGNIYIVNNQSLSNINNLGNLRLLGGNLDLRGNEALTDFVELENLEHIGGGLILINNDSMTDIMGLGGITKLDMLAVGQNDLLQNFTGLKNLAVIHGQVDISTNDSLQNLDGLNKLSEIGASLLLLVNRNLSSLQGFENLHKINGSLYVNVNSTLTNLDGFSNLDSINGYISIYNNSSLTSIDGLRNIDPETIKSKNEQFEDLSIIANPLLSDCSIESICSLLERENATTDIRENKEGCNTEAEVESNCTTGSLNLNQFEFLTYPNPASSQITIDAPDAYKWHRWSIYSIEGKELHSGSLSESDELTIYGLESYSNGIYILKMISEEGKIGLGKFIIE